MAYVSTIHRIQNLQLTTNVNGGELAKLFELHGIKISAAKLSVALKDGKFANFEFDQSLRPILDKLEYLVAAFEPLPLNLNCPELIKSLLDLISIGVNFGGPNSFVPTTTSHNVTGPIAAELNEGKVR